MSIQIKIDPKSMACERGHQPDERTRIVVALCKELSRPWLAWVDRVAIFKAIAQVQSDAEAMALERMHLCPMCNPSPDQRAFTGRECECRRTEPV